MLIKKARQKGAIPNGKTTVTHLLQSFVFADVETEAVIMGAPIVELTGGLLLPDKIHVADFGFDKIFVPLEEVTHGSEQSSISVDVFERHVGVEFASGFVVGNRPPFNDASEIVAPGCARHS